MKPNNDIINQLEKLAGEVQQKFPVVTEKLRMAKRPFFIELSGTPKSGKTTGANRLELFLRRNNFRVRTLVERASTCPIRRKDHIYFNIWTACSTLTQMLEALEYEHQIVIIDRGLFDALCWMNWLERTGQLTQNEKKIINDFILMDRWNELLDIIFVLKVNPNNALDREFAGQLTKRPGSIMNEDTLKQFNDSIDSVYQTYKSLFKRIIFLDTNTGDPVKTVEEITDNTLRYLNDFLGEKIFVLPKEILIDIGIRGGFISDSNIIGKLLKVISDKPLFLDRARIESNLNYVQLIPIVYFQYNGRFLLLRRKEEDPRDRMHERYVIWAGGHIREQDNTENNTILNCLMRELNEELYIKSVPTPELVGVVLDTSSVRSACHVGIVYKMLLDNPDIAISMNQKEFKESKGKSVSGKFCNSTELENYYDQMENWSRMILVNYLRIIDKPVPQQIILF